jgi:hypothetical protein
MVIFQKSPQTHADLLDLLKDPQYYPRNTKNLNLGGCSLSDTFNIMMSVFLDTYGITSNFRFSLSENMLTWGIPLYKASVTGFGDKDDITYLGQPARMSKSIAYSDEGFVFLDIPQLWIGNIECVSAYMYNVKSLSGMYNELNLIFPGHVLEDKFTKHSKINKRHA